MTVAMTRATTPPPAPLVARTESIVQTPEYAAHKRMSAAMGIAGESKYYDYAMPAQGETPRDQMEALLRERRGIHTRLFRPSTSLHGVTFDEIALKKQKDPLLAAMIERTSQRAKMQRPSLIKEYVSHGTPILARSGEELHQRREKADANALRVAHGRYWQNDTRNLPFDNSPGGSRPNPTRRPQREWMHRERQVVARVREALRAPVAARLSPERIRALHAPADIGSPGERASAAAVLRRQPSPAPPNPAQEYYNQHNRNGGHAATLAARGVPNNRVPRGDVGHRTTHLDGPPRSILPPGQLPQLDIDVDPATGKPQIRATFNAPLGAGGDDSPAGTSLGSLSVPRSTR
jgi:hypothetical protein